MVENSFSDWSAVVSGVPQGSVLGPVLFIIFVNDIADNVALDVSLNIFADDVKLYSRVSDTLDANALQQVLDEIVCWADKWQLSVNISKSTALHLGSRNLATEYYINGRKLDSTETTRDLGVETDNRLSYDSHIENIVRQAYSRVGILFKAFVSRDCTLLKKAYITYIRPVLEYASSIWSPYKVKHIAAIEKIQRNFSRRIPELHDLSYEERLARLNLDTLELRRLKSDLVFYFKTMNGLTPFDSHIVFHRSQSTKVTRSQDKTLLQKPVCKTKILENNFFTRRVNCWNTLPESVKNSPSVAHFKKALTRIDFSEYMLIK